MSAYYAVTSLSGRDGTWVIVADGESAPAVEQQAVGAITGANPNVTLLNLTLAEEGAKKRLDRLEVMTRPWAIGRVGLAKMQQYERLTRGVTAGVQTAGGSIGGDGGAGSAGGGGVSGIPPMSPQ